MLNTTNSICKKHQALQGHRSAPFVGVGYFCGFRHCGDKGVTKEDYRSLLVGFVGMVGGST